MEMQKIYSNENRTVIAYAESRIGGRSENQDSYGWFEVPRGYLVTVCDGMGGGPGGKTASTIAVNEIVRCVAEASADEDCTNILKKAIRNANMAIIQAGNNHPKLKGMGATATVLWVTDYAAYAAHVGDSRIYQLRGKHKVFRTFDHSMVFSMVEQGVITEEQARLSAQSNVITRAMGINPDVEVDVKELSYEKGDRFVLCTDGIHGTMPERDLLKLLTNKKLSLGTLVDDVATSVDCLGQSKGGKHDNLTIVMVETKVKSKLKVPMNKRTKIVFAALVTLALASLSVNFMQMRSNRAEVCATDSVKLLKDSIAQQNKVIEACKGRTDSLAHMVKGMKAMNDQNEKIAKIVNELQETIKQQSSATK